MQTRSRTAALAAALLLQLSAGAAHAVTADGQVPMTTPAPGDTSPFSDTEPDERGNASRERFGDYQSEAYKNALLQTAQQQASLYGGLLPGGALTSGVPQWRSLGPTNAKYQTNGVTLKVADSGRVRTVLQSAANPDTVFVLTSGGGLWKTQTFSHTNPSWQPKTDALLTTSGGALAFGRTADVLYLGTGDPFDGLPALGGLVARSSDGGETWQAFANLPGAFSVNDIKVDSSGAQDMVLVAADTGVYRSTDAGRSFSLVAASAGRRAWSLARTSAGWGPTFAPYGVGSTSPGVMLVSADNGASWSPIPNVGGGYANAGRTTLGVARPGDSVVYAFAANMDGFGQHDLYRSADGGLTWSALGITGKTPTNPNGFQPDMNLMGQQGWYDQMLLVDDADPSRRTIYLGGQLATAKSVDGGATWTLISDWLPGYYSNLPYVHADQHTASFITLNGQRGMVFGTDGGIFVSTDGGASFSFDKNEGIVSFLSQTVTSSPRNPQTVITGLQDTGTRARLGSSGFYNQVFGGDGEGVGWSQANDLVALVTVPGCVISGPALQPNTRNNWQQEACFRGGLFYTSLASPTSAADPSGQLFLSASAFGPVFTPDGGTTWYYLAAAGSRLPADFRVRTSWHNVGIDPTAALARFAVAGAGGKIAISTNGAASWVVKTLADINVPGFGGYITSPAWTSSGTLYVASENPAAGTVHVIRSDDGGATWVRSDSGLPDAGVYHIVANPRDRSGRSAYAATYLGVYQTTNGGVSWSRFGAALPAVRATGLWVSEDGSLLRVATYGRGLWEINP